METRSNTLPRLPPYLLLDAWRGIAALWVVMVHSCLAYVANGHPEALRNPIFSVSMWGQLGVVLFFVISGYCIFGAAYSCISVPTKAIGRFALDRLRRIYPPYFAACAIALAVGAFTSALQRWHVLPPSSSLRALPLHDYTFWLTNLTLTQLPMGMPPLLFVAWSLCYEIIFYVIVGAFVSLSTLVGAVNLPQRNRILAGAGILTTIGSLIWLLFSPSTCPFPFDRWYQFGFGALLFAIVSNGGLRSSLLIRAFALLCVILCLSYACFSASLYSELGHPSARIQAFVCVFFFLTLLLLQPFNEQISRWRPVVPFMWLGTFSYSIYLVHMVAIPFPDAGLRKMGFDGSLYVITYLAELVVAIIAGWLFFVLVERRFISLRQQRRVETELQTTVA